MKTKSLFTFALLCAVAQGAWAQASGESISYIDRQWDAVNKTVVETERTISTYTEITGQKENEYIDLESGKWYVIKDADAPTQLKTTLRPKPEPNSTSAVTTRSTTPMLPTSR